MADLKQRLVLVAALLSPSILAPQAQAYEELIQLLQDKRCPQCRELRQLTKSRQLHTSLSTVYMLSTITCLTHSPKRHSRRNFEQVR